MGKYQVLTTNTKFIYHFAKFEVQIPFSQGVQKEGKMREKTT